MKLSLIGCGAMGSAMAKRFVLKHELTVYDRNSKKAADLAHEIGAKAAQNLEAAAKGAQVIILAIKPKDVDSFAKEMHSFTSSDTIIVSVLSGVKIEALSRLFPKSKILRTMPNIAVTYEKGVVGIAEPHDMPVDLKRKAEEIFQGMGLLVFIPENKIDELSALTGSAPAFVFHMIEAMTEGGIYLGFPADQALALVLQVFEGAVAILKETKAHPAAVKWQVASPGGTTIEGLKVLEQEKVHYALMHALQVTAAKAASFGK